MAPIEHYIHAMATERALPDAAIAFCTVRIEESAPALRAILVRAAEGETLSEDEKLLVFRGLHILGGARDSQACRPLLRLLRRPHDEVEDLLGDAITETMPKIVAGVFDGDADALFDGIVDRSIDEFVREALFGAATFLAWDGRFEPVRMERFLEQFYEGRRAADGDLAWVGWLEAIALLGLRNLAPLVRRAWQDGRVPEGILDRSDFEKDLADAERAPGDIGRFKLANLGYIDDVIESLDWTRRAESPIEEQPLEPLWADGLRQPSTPMRNPWRHVGRNDPCPCGSGKKAKKCCLAN
ncbi:hypothetical protein GCM10011611_20270 [Aliidongia dinghuensis]|uniref:DUF1186 domain-containing protein n=1 Tax=Aliidongia dinghuensis TaxID=1867774 RepID=A0A8J3E2X6_9PROT|nr:DUF1186 domain-containing protein [Aliidongia dinghuensis]GGF14419.1 hypothetical protein GCM10011611_20270 [Aliidongia dinghuensis]